MTRTAGGLVVDVHEHVASVIVDRPERRNALSRAVRRELVEVFDDFSRDDDIWVVTIRGSGDLAFSAGVDLKEMGESDQSSQRPQVPMSGVERNQFEVIAECTKPTVAVVNGVALGGGCELALACDMRIAARHAQFGLPEAKRGLVANFGSQMLPRLVPGAIAYEMMYLGESLPADEALRWGLVNRVVPSGELDEAARSLTAGLVANAPLALRRYKQMVVKGRDLPMSAALRLDVGPSPYLSEDRIEGVAAFNEHRAPVWQGR